MTCEPEPQGRKPSGSLCGQLLGSAAWPPSVRNGSAFPHTPALYPKATPCPMHSSPTDPAGLKSASQYPVRRTLRKREPLHKAVGIPPGQARRMRRAAQSTRRMIPVTVTNQFFHVLFAAIDRTSVAPRPWLPVFPHLHPFLPQHHGQPPLPPRSGGEQAGAESGPQLTFPT